MGNFISFQSSSSKGRQQTDRETQNLMLESQKVKEFFGKMDEWPKWKNRTQCAFDGSGYEQIIEDEVFAESNPKMNRIVYSQLAVATVDGTAYHLVKQHEDSRDGHGAWTALITWYDGDSVKYETAKTIRSRLETLWISQGKLVEHYTNKFQTSVQELDRIDGEKYLANHKLTSVYVILRNPNTPPLSLSFEVEIAPSKKLSPRSGRLNET